jgi:predicted N-formylglutamate amidohydrolase
MIEIRNDGLRTTAQTDAWAERLAAAYREIEGQAVNLGRSRADI